AEPGKLPGLIFQVDGEHAHLLPLSPQHAALFLRAYLAGRRIGPSDRIVASHPWEPVPAMEPDEASPGQHPHRLQAIFVLLVQDALSGPAGANRLYQASSGPELGGQRRRYAGERSGDQHRVERGMIRDSFGSVAHYDDDVVDTRRGQVVP